MTSTRYVFTINNPEAPLDTAAWEAAGVRLAVWQQERGAEGTPHLQGYITFKRTTAARREALARRTRIPRTRQRKARAVRRLLYERRTRASEAFYWPDHQRR